MSFTEPSQGQENNDGAGNEPAVEHGFASDPNNDSGTTPDPNSQQQGGSDESLANPFLSNIPEQDREVVAKYIKDWDAGVTRKFQEIHSQYEPYKQLGVPVEDLQAAYNVYQQLNSDPKGFYEALADALSDELEQGPSGTPQKQNPAYEGLPPEFQAEFQQTRKAVEAMAQFILDQQNQTKQQQEDEELDNYLSQLKEKHGDFDEEFVLTKMYTSNMDGEQAIQAWKTAMQNYVNQVGGVQEKKNGFKPLNSNGGGAVPTDDSKKVTDLSRKETKNLVAQLMQQSVES